MIRARLVSVPALLLAWAVLTTPAPVLRAAAPRPNVVVILTDDQGWGDLSASGNTDLSTPNIDSLAKSGVSLDRFFVCAVCSPTRAEFLTGRYHPRGGVRGVSTGGERLDLDERTIADVFKAAGYATGAFGKWHMSDTTTWPSSPWLAGYDVFGSVKANLGHQSFTRWEHNDNGQVSWFTGYVTTRNVDDSLAFATSAIGPWFNYLAFNAAHRPWHTPPAHLHTVPGLLPGGWPGPGSGVDPRPYWLAMIEAVDTELGRLLADVDLNETTVILMGDNGSGQKVMDLPFSRNGKGSVFEGGIRAPLIIAGAGVVRPGRVISELCQAEDIYATVIDLAGLGPTGDGVSLKPYLDDLPVHGLRRYSYIELFKPNGPGPYTEFTQVLLDGHWKLMRGTTPGFYDLSIDPYEASDLLAGGPLTPPQQSALDELTARFEEFRN
jgi:arylsulfatase A-like enzyme